MLPVALSTGASGIAMAGIDMADGCIGQASGLPPYSFLVEISVQSRHMPVWEGASPTLAHEAEEMVEQGFRAIKFKIGFESVKTDLEIIHAVRSAVGKEIELMVDYNQFLSVSEAHTSVLKWLDEEGLSWIEEPTRAE